MNEIAYSSQSVDLYRKLIIMRMIVSKFNKLLSISEYIHCLCFGIQCELKWVTFPQKSLSSVSSKGGLKR